MHLIFGGAYQGKRDYVKNHYQLKEEDIFSFVNEESGAGLPKEAEMDFTKKAIDQLEDFILCCVRLGVEATNYLELHKEEWKEMIFICTDISAGIVPCEKELRAWREMAGRTLMYLGKEAEEVTRVFCGIPQKIK